MIANAHPAATASQGSATSNSPGAESPLATWQVRHPRLLACLVGLVPVLFTAAPLAAAKSQGASDRIAYFAAAAGVSLSALLALLVMILAKPRLAGFGLQRPQRLRAVLFAVPALVTPLVVLVSTPPSISGSLAAPLAWLALAAAFSEELWYRGIVLSLLRGRGTRYAVVASSVIFAVLHLSNLAGGKSLTYAILQLAFAALFGFVAAQLTSLTSSLVPAIAWHFAWDLFSYLGGDELTTPALVGLGVVVVILLGYAAWLWRRLPA